MQESNQTDSRIFLNRINWDVSTGKIARLIKLQINTYKFIFTRTLCDEALKSFVQYVNELDTTKRAAIMMIWVWLYQHNVEFKLKFGYNPNASLKYNLRNLLSPRKLNKQLKSYGHNDIMACPLNEI